LREFNLFQDLPESKVSRPITRTIQNRIIASERGQEYYDGDRDNGFGGYVYDGRWKPVAQRIIHEYGLKNNSSILHVGCDKGFLLYDLHKEFPKLYLRGLELSNYALRNAPRSIYSDIRMGPWTWFPLPNSRFHFVIATGIYSLNLPDVIKCLKEIERVGQGKSFITLGAFETEEEEKLYRQWSLLGTTILSKDDWREVLEHVNYTGDYWFTTATTLNLVSD